MLLTSSLVCFSTDGNLVLRSDTALSAQVLAR